MSKPPKKERRPRTKKISVLEKNQWKNILKEIDKDEIPIDLLLSITVNLIDGTKVKIDIKELLDSGNDPEVLEKALDHKFRTMDQFIENIDFYVNIEDIARTVQPITDQILKDL